MFAGWRSVRRTERRPSARTCVATSAVTPARSPPPAPRRSPRASARSWPGRRRRATASAAGGRRPAAPPRRAPGRRRSSSSAPVARRTATVPVRSGARLAEAIEDACDRVAVCRASAGDRLEARSADLRLERGGRALGDDVPVVDDPDTVGEHVRLLEVLRRQEDGDALLAGEPARPPPRAPSGSGCRVRSSARRGRGCGGRARARARGRAGASCRPE